MASTQKMNGLLIRLGLSSLSVTVSSKRGQCPSAEFYNSHVSARGLFISGLLVIWLEYPDIRRMVPNHL